jgi:hypothetical protein
MSIEPGASSPSDTDRSNELSPRTKIVIAFLDVLALASVANCIPLVTYLVNQGPGSLRAVGVPFVYRLTVAAWAAAAHYGLVRRKRWGRECGTGLFGLLLFGAAAGLMLSLLPITNVDRVMPNLLPWWAYATVSAFVSVPLVLLQTSKPPGAPALPPSKGNHPG